MPAKHFIVYSYCLVWIPGLNMESKCMAMCSLPFKYHQRQINCYHRWPGTGMMDVHMDMIIILFVSVTHVSLFVLICHPVYLYHVFGVSYTQFSNHFPIWAIWWVSEWLSLTAFRDSGHRGPLRQIWYRVTSMCAGVKWTKHRSLYIIMAPLKTHKDILLGKKLNFIKSPIMK